MQAVAPTSIVTPASTAPQAKPGTRNVAVDVYRGFVMFLMMAEVLQLARVARAFPGNWFWGILGWNQTHVEWAGCSLHDLIQPSFSFLVGVALPYSIASRIAKGGTFGRLFMHALWRSFLLIFLGVFLRSLHSPMLNFTFEDTLTQIGLGYPLLFLLGFRPPRWAWAALAIILVGYWAAWAMYPLPPAGFDTTTVGVKADWLAQHGYTGFAAHWNKNMNAGQAFDTWFLNLFPRQKPFLYNGGGYLTLSFIPTLGTMILGLIAGWWLRADQPRIPFRKLLLAGVAGLALGAILHYSGICPVVKRIWTPSWTLFSGGACFLLVAAFAWVLDVKQWRAWAFPLTVIGMNSIAAYLIAHLFERFFEHTFDIMAWPVVTAFGRGIQPFAMGALILFAYWLVLFWMYRRKIFLRI